VALVSIFSAAFCPGGEVAREAARRLGCPLRDDDYLVQLCASRFSLPAKKLARTLWPRPGMLNRISREQGRLLAHLRLGLARLLGEDEALVYHGSGAHLAPRGISHLLAVCLVADKAWRLERARQEGLSAKAAAAALSRGDQAALAWVQLLRGSDPWQADLYDILIPLPKRSPDQAVELICRNAQSPPLDPTPASHQALADFELAARVEVALARAGHHLPQVRVEARQGRVEMVINKKVLRLGRLQEKLQALARGVEGVESAHTRVGPGFHRADLYRRVEVQMPAKVLLVDDEREFVETLSERLLLRDIGSAVVYDGEQALALLAREEPEVMVLDLKMPGLDGMEVLRRIKRDHPRVEVIILTGHGSARDRERCLELGAFAYLQKPVDIEELSQTMRRAQERARAGED